MTEFDDVIRRLEDGRPQATARELDDNQAASSPPRGGSLTEGNQSMKSRFAILAMLVTGMLFSTAGAGLAVQGGAETPIAVAQYADADAHAAVRTVPPRRTAPARVASTATSARRAASSRPRSEDSPEQSGEVRGAEEGPASCRPRGPRRVHDDAARAPDRGRGRDEPAAVDRLRGDPRPDRRPRAAAGRPDPAPPDRLAANQSVRNGGPPARPRAGGPPSLRPPQIAHSARANGSSGLSRKASRGVRAGVLARDAVDDRLAVGICQLSGSRSRAASMARCASAYCPARASQ